MFSRKVIIYALLLLILATLPIWIFREPSYEGRSLSQWLADASSGAGNIDNPDRTSSAAEAIRAIGPKALPHLVGMLSAGETLLGELHRELGGDLVIGTHRILSPWEKQRRGVIGLQILGPAAAPALPEILRLLESNSGRMDLWFLLEKIGPSSIVAAPLLERSFPDFARNGENERRWQEDDFHPQWLASDLMMTWGGPYRELVSDQLLRKTSPLLKRVSCVWTFRKDPEYARRFMDSMAAIIADPSEPPLLKIACLHALGRLPDPDPTVIMQAIEKYEAQFGPLPLESISNGDFAQSHWTGTNQMPGDPKAP